MIENKEEKIKELKSELDMCIKVRENEKSINRDLKVYNESLETTISKLGKLNDELIKENSILKLRLKNLITEIV